MYQIDFLPIAKKDIEHIIYYISHNLKNKIAAIKLRDLFINSLNDIILFPYGNSVYQSKETLKDKYRSYRVKNFIMFYTINEEKKLITIVRVLYQKMDIHNILE